MAIIRFAQHGGSTNAMAAAWACVLDFGQTPKVTVVLDKATRTGAWFSALDGAGLISPAGSRRGGCRADQCLADSSIRSRIVQT